MSAALDFNSRNMKEDVASAVVNDAIDAGLMRKRGLQEQRAYVGASSVGGSCERQVQLEFAGAPREKDFEGKTLRIFDRGHTFEELTRGWLIDAGFEIVQRSQRTGQPFAFSQLEGRFKGHVDGVILAGPEGWKYPLVWEHKALGSKGYREIVKDGLRKACPTYWAQIQIYMAYLDLAENPAMFSITNADTCEQEHIPVPFDPEVAQAMTDRAVRIVQATDAGDLLPRPFKDKTYFECRFCAFAERCWGLPA